MTLEISISSKDYKFNGKNGAIDGTSSIMENLSDKFLYSSEFDEREDVKKIYIIRGVCLYFVPIEGTDKYTFCSADKKLQERCESVKNKNVKGKNIKYIVDAAKKYMKGETQLPEKSTGSVCPNRRDNPVGTLQNILQQQGKMPEYSPPRDGAFGGVTVRLSVDGYEPIIQWAQNQRDARRACAIEFAKTCLGIDVEAEQSLVTGENTNTQQVKYQTEKLPNSFKVDADVCGNWDRDAVSALQVFCQKNKLGVPKYISKGTSQGYITESTICMRFGDFSTIKSAPTKQEAKQKCAKAFYEKLKSGHLNSEAELQKNGDKIPNPALFGGWIAHPRFTLENYCEYYNIRLNIDDVGDQVVMTVGDEKFYTNGNEYTNSGVRYKRDLEVKEELARFYYATKIRPILKKMEREKINNSSKEVLDKFPTIDMSKHLEHDNIAWAGVLNQLCAKAHISNPWYETYKLKDGIETKCGFPAKINMKSWREGESRVVYMKIAGMEEKFRGEGNTFKDAQHDAAKNFLIKMWEKKEKDKN